MRGARDGLRWVLDRDKPRAIRLVEFPAHPEGLSRGGGPRRLGSLSLRLADDIDIWSPNFVDRFAAFSAAAARLIREETGDVPVPLSGQRNLILGLGGGEVGDMNPCASAAAMN
jgi:hypothetical protein